MAKGQEMEKTGPAEIEVIEFEPYTAMSGETWDEAAAGAIEIPGFDLITDEQTDALEGVPFLVTGVTYRPGIPYPDGRLSAYVSVEARVAPAELIQRRRIDPDKLPFDPDSHVVFNDGSTGIYRQITELLAGMGYIVLGESGVTGNARRGESKLDQSPGEWADIKFGEVKFDNDGQPTYFAPLRLRASRGLRLSRYENEFTAGGQAVTRYIA